MKSFLSELRLYICNKIVANIPSHSIRIFFYNTIMHFNISEGSTCFMNCSFDAKGKFDIGKNSVVNTRCRLDTRGGIYIGENVIISSEVIILTADHDMDLNSMPGRVKAVKIDDYAWIGTRAMILPGVTIGKGAVVAAGAVVTKNVEPYKVVAGVPAKMIKERLLKQDYTYSGSFKRLFN